MRNTNKQISSKNTNTNSIHILDKGVSLSDIKVNFRERKNLKLIFIGANVANDTRLQISRYEFSNAKCLEKMHAIFNPKSTFYVSNIFGSHQCAKSVYVCLGRA